MNIFNRKKQKPDEFEPTPFETEMLRKLKGQEEFNQILMKKIIGLETQLKDLKEYVHEENDVVYKKVTIESRKTNEYLKHMNDIQLTSEDIKKFIDIGYEYLQEEYEFEIIPEPTEEILDARNINFEDLPPITITSTDETKRKEETKHKIKQLENDLETEDNQNQPVHLLPIAKSLRVPYNLKLVHDGKLRNAGDHGKTTKFTIHDIITLKERIPEYVAENYTFKEMSFHYPKLSLAVVKRLIWNIEEGIFDPLIDEYNNKDSSDHSNLSFQLHNQQKIRYKIKKVDGIDIYRLGQGTQKLNFNLLDVLYIKENLPRWEKEGTSRPEICEEVGFSEKQLMRVIYNVQIGTFDEHLKEFEDSFTEHEFSNINDELYIDGEATGLTISKCNLIVYEYTNAADKYSCLKNLLHTYKEISSKHLLIVTQYYDDNDFSKLLRDKKDKVQVINNPQKRREILGK